MVLKATAQQQKEWDTLPSRREMGKRRIVSFIAFYTVLCALFLPFRPCTWITLYLQTILMNLPPASSFFHPSPPPIPSESRDISTERQYTPPPPTQPQITSYYSPRAHAIDNFLTPFFIFGGMYLHYSISCIIFPNPLTLPLPYIRFRIFTYKHTYYWKFIATELTAAFIIMGMRLKAPLIPWSETEREDVMVRRWVAAGWMGMLWVVAPEGVKVRVKGFLESWWVYCAWGEVRDESGRRVNRRG